ncbi:MAG: hypothetical protein V3S16_07355, partial [Candidatus Desulfatibia sp.]|uniref:hypothetical protein n=1 Tax=Candidatus Desulfatibia sp. TaxID=3101189 RepID=UPI002F325C8A
MKKTLVIFIVFFTASVAFASIKEDKKLFETKCVKCHLLERALRKTKSLKAWKRTGKRMARYS